MSWIYDHPPIDSPPGQSHEANLALEELYLSIPPGDSDFGFDDWNRIATYTDQFIRLAGDLFQAAHSYTARWRQGRAPATLPPSGLAQFEGIPPPELYERSLQMATFGVFRFGDRAPAGFPQSGYTGVNDDPEESGAWLWGEVLKGRLLVFAERSEPYARNLMGSILSYVTRSEVTNPDNTNVRNISDPSNEVHDRIDNDRQPQRITPRRQNVARRALYWKRR